MRYVLYQARASRRAESNRALARAAVLANEHDLPLLFYEELPCDAPDACDRFHTFVLEGVEETGRRLARVGIGYVFYLPRRRSDPQSVLPQLAADAAAVVTDEHPLFPPVAYEAVDSSCIVPAALFEERAWAAYSFRPRIRKLLPEYLKPVEMPRLRRAWPKGKPRFHTPVADAAAMAASCEIDHGVAPSRSFQGGRTAAERTLCRFLEERLRRYARDKNEPSAHATSDLSPYLHFGHISALEVALAARDYASEHKLMAEEFLEELIVRRELAFNFVRHTPPPYTLAALPDWARRTLGAHARDRRDPSYAYGEFEQALTHDPLWNATQKELVARGKIHGYYRMYWGKKIIEWSRTHEEALQTMIRLHDRYALDGHDPNTYTNILWCFGLHDRPWSDRPVFGTIRYMSYDGMRRKTDVEAYIREIEALQ